MRLGLLPPAFCAPETRLGKSAATPAAAAPATNDRRDVELGSIDSINIPFISLAVRLGNITQSANLVKTSALNFLYVGRPPDVDSALVLPGPFHGFLSQPSIHGIACSMDAREVASDHVVWSRCICQHAVRPGCCKPHST